MIDRERQKLHMQMLLSMVPEFIARLSWTREQIEERQRRDLVALLEYARERSSWHRARLAGIDLDHFTLEDLPCLPAMTKADLMANWDDIVTVGDASLADVKAHLAGPAANDYIFSDKKAVASGGTSGETGYFLYDWEAWPTHLAGMNRSYFPLLARLGDPTKLVAATISADVPTHISYSLSRTFSQESNTFHRIPVTAQLPAIVGSLNNLRPDFLHVYPSVLALLADATQSGSLVHFPKIVLSTSEPLPLQYKSFVRDVWGALILDVWTTTEATGSFACPGGDGFHISEDLNVVEPIHADGTIADPGDATASAVLITNLYNRALPLIRYRIEDQLQFGTSCACGSAYLYAERVNGRNDFYFFYPGGEPIHPVAFESALVHVPGIIAFQVRQTKDGADVDIVARGALDLEAIALSIEKSLEQAGLEAPRVRCFTAEAIPRTSGGKIKQFVPLETQRGR